MSTIKTCVTQDLFIILIPIVTELGKSARANMKQRTCAETKHSKAPVRCPLSAHNCTYTKPPRPVTVLLHRRNEKCTTDNWVRQNKKKNYMKKRKYKK